jgi:hypothetical protein
VENHVHQINVSFSLSWRKKVIVEFNEFAIGIIVASKASVLGDGVKNWWYWLEIKN